MTALTQLHDAAAARAAAIAVQTAVWAADDAAGVLLERAKEVSKECAYEAEQKTAERQSWIGRLSRRLETWITDGSHGDRPADVADIKAVQRQMTVQANADAAAEVLARFEGKKRETAEERRVADAAVEAAIENELAANAEVIAEQIEEHFAQVERLGAELRLYQPDDRNIPLNRLGAQRAPSHRVCRVLERLDFMSTENRIAINTPLDELPNVAGVLATRSDFLAQRRSALMSGEPEAPPAVPPEQQEHAA